MQEQVSLPKRGRGQKGGGSQLSVSTNRKKNTDLAKDDIKITNSINETFNKAQKNMTKAIRAAMYENNHQVFNTYRQEYSEAISKLEKEREIINKKKGKRGKASNKDKDNSQKRLFYMATAINDTVRYFKKLYFPDNNARIKKLKEIEDDQKVLPEERVKNKLDQLKKFFESNFIEDRKFAISYLSSYTRDKLSKSIPIVNVLFYDKIFEFMLNTKNIQDECKQSLDIFTNLIHSEEQRQRLVKQEYIKRVIDAYQSGPLLERAKDQRNDDEHQIMVKVSWMTALLSFYPDMIEEIIKLNLLDFIINLCSKQYSTEIRANAVLALSLLTYHDAMFDELLDKRVIDFVMALCKDTRDDIIVKEYSTLALVHFALNKRSINFLIDKGVMDLFNSFGSFSGKVIKTNISWIFLALCNNGITGKKMLESGITKDMFLVSCDKNLEQIRHLVIAGFAELGKCLDLKIAEPKRLSGKLQKIKQSAMIGMHKNFKLEPEKTVKILLHFTVSNNEIYQSVTYWSLKEYIMLNHDHLIEDMSDLIQALINGSIIVQEEVNTESANAIAFLIKKSLVYGVKQKDQPSNYVLDALMHLTGHTSKFIKTRAFSTLSTLSSICSSSEEVKTMIENDLKLPDKKTSKEYYDYIKNRMEQNLEQFKSKYIMQDKLEEEYAGLFWLLRIAKEPSAQIINDAAENMFQFITNINLQTKNEQLNETFYIYVFQALKHAHEDIILVKLLKVIKHYIHSSSPLQKEVINPDTILWLLKLLKKHDQDQLLACRAGVTLLEIVQIHQINFDYQEVAIIRKFNIALQSLGVFEPHHISDEEEEMKNLSKQTNDEQNSQISGGKTRHEQSKMTMNTNQQNNSNIMKSSKSSKKHGSASKKGSSKPASINGQSQEGEQFNNSQVHTDQDQDKSEIEDIYGDEREESEEEEDDDDEEESEESKSLQKSSTHKSSASKKSEKQAQDNLTSNPNQTFTSLDNLTSGNITLPQATVSHQEYNKQDIAGYIAPESHPTLSEHITSKVSQSQNNQVGQSQQLQNDNATHNTSLHEEQLLLINQSDLSQDGKSMRQMSLQNISGTKGSVVQEQFQLRDYTNVQILKDALVSSKTRLIETRKNSTVINSRPISVTSEQKGLDIISIDNITEVTDPNKDEQAVQQILRESLIKAFLVIFTNENSQHLLLNQDLIDLAFNCLEFTNELADEAQQKLARLISIIYKFPQIQQYMVKPEVVRGVTHLLTVTDSFPDIISNTVKACTYMTLNFDFVSSSSSINMLKNLMPLTEYFRRSKEPKQQEDDIINVIQCITNLIGGSKENKTYFFEQGGVWKYLMYILESEDQKFIELLVHGIQEIASLNLTLLFLVKQDDISQITALKQILVKCLIMTDNWLDFIKQNQSAIEAAQKKQNQGSEDTNNHQSEYNVMGKLVEYQDDRKKSILFASKSIMIRNNIYYIISRCLKAGMNKRDVEKECNLTKRLITDLTKCRDNYFMFGNLLATLDSLKDDVEFINETIIENYPQLLTILHDYPNHENKIALMKKLINLVVRSVDILCESKEGVQIIALVLKMIDHIKTDEEMQENIIWLVNSMVEQGDSQNVIQVCAENKVVAIIADQLTHDKQERTLLQTFQTLKTLSKDPSLLEHFMDSTILTRLYTISQHPKLISNLELRTCLYQLLSILSYHNPQICDLMLQLGFLGQLFKELNNHQYIVEQANYDEDEQQNSDQMEGDQLSEEYDETPKKDQEEASMTFRKSTTNMNTGADEGARKMNLKNIMEEPDQFGFNKSRLVNGDSVTLVETMYDTIDRQQSANEMLEAIYQIVSNICFCNSSYQIKLIEMGLIDLLKTFLMYFCSYQYFSPVKQSKEMIDITNLGIGNISLVKSISLIIHSLTKNSAIQELLIHRDMISVIKHCNRLLEYEVLTNTYLSIGNLMLSPLEHVRKRAVELGCMEILLDSNEESEFLRIRRICNSVLQQTDPRLFEYNDLCQ